MLELPAFAALFEFFFPLQVTFFILFLSAFKFLLGVFFLLLRDVQYKNKACLSLINIQKVHIDNLNRQNDNLN